MRTLLLFALLVPCIALGAPRKVTQTPKSQAAEQVGKERAQAGDDRPAQDAKAHGDPHVSEKANVKATSKAVEAPAQK